ncbi:MAG: hypothetical protein J1E01_06650 [Acetatifactor sp.]|nr:hypothetical protein [Acetatifactor sp.]
MKKSIIKLLVFAAAFVLALVVISRLMNQGHDNLTMEMAEASFPLVTMELEGIEYNQLHGYSFPMDVAFQRDTVTVLGESRSTGFVVDTFGRNVTGISIQVRSVDGSRLIEDTELTEYEMEGNRIHGNIALKDLIDRDTDYSLTIVLELNESSQVYYYTKVIWSSRLNPKEKLEYVLDFHQRLYDREAARELTKYLETNSLLEDNSSFHNVNIHSSFRQITWADLPVQEVTTPTVRITEIASQTASLLVDYVVSTTNERGTVVYYMVQEHFRIRYTPDRMYLLDYQRNMTQIPDTEQMYANDKILLGITSDQVPMMESEDGNIVVFQVANQLFSYNITSNKLTVIFSFYDRDNADWRTIYGQHAIEILDVDEGGNVQFALYGYMNRGRHEGEVGIQLYTYNSGLNTIEELLYIPYDKTYAVLSAELDNLLYLNRDQKLYLKLENMVYEIDLVKRECVPLVQIIQDGSMHVSDNNKILVWSEGQDIHHSQVLNVRNLSTGSRNSLTVGGDEAILPLGFMKEDIIYGVARLEDIYEENSGRIFFPMYKICISSSGGELLKEYRQDGMYVTDIQVEGNQITLQRLRRQESGEYREAAKDQIMNNMETEMGKNVIVSAVIDVYERYVQIQTKGVIDSKNIMILNPKEVVYEGGREIGLPKQENVERYYVYGPYGVSGIYSAPAGAVNQAYSIAGVVVNDRGECIWLRGNRSARNQISAIRETGLENGETSLAVCLDTIFGYEGLSRSSGYLLSRGQSVLEILEDNLEDAQILDLTGCSVDAVLYYVNRNIPVLALMRDGEAVLITGFDEYNTILLEPAIGRLYRKGLNDSAEWFSENGNCFITYVRP